MQKLQFYIKMWVYVIKHIKQSYYSVQTTHKILYLTYKYLALRVSGLVSDL